MQRTGKAAVVILVAFAVVLARNLPCKAEDKSPGLLYVADKLMNLKHSISDLALDIETLRFDYMNDMLTTASLKDEILSKEAQLESLLVALEDLRQRILPNRGAVSDGREATEWNSAYACTGQLRSAVFALRSALLSIKKITTYGRFSPDWVRSCDEADIRIERAMMRVDIAMQACIRLMPSLWSAAGLQRLLQNERLITSSVGRIWAAGLAQEIPPAGRWLRGSTRHSEEGIILVAPVAKPPRSRVSP